jgi:small subunit ribosomal protein S20
MVTSAQARTRNRRDRSRYRDAEKKVLSIQDKKVAASELKQAFRLFDHLAAKGVLHRNTAARHKAKIARHVAALQG